MKTYWVYICANWNRKRLYVCVTSDLARRLEEHKRKTADGFTARYNINRLVYCEDTPDVNAAIAREKQVKSWRREKKDALITSANPEWRELES